MNREGVAKLKCLWWPLWHGGIDLARWGWRIGGGVTVRGRKDSGGCCREKKGPEEEIAQEERGCCGKGG